MEDRAMTAGTAHLYHMAKTMATHVWRETPVAAKNNTIILAVGGPIALIVYAIHKNYCIKITENAIILEPSTVAA